MATTAIAGWLFADLLLAFSIVVLGTQDPPPRPLSSPSPGATPTPTATRQALERKFVTIQLSVNASQAAHGDGSVVKALRAVVNAEPKLRGRKAGIVLTFGAQHDGGEGFAHNINKLLGQVNSRLFADVATRDLQIVGAGGGALILQIYLFYNE
jgi:hypothetical protein